MTIISLIILSFSLSLGLALLTTPLLARLGKCCGTLDWPNFRKIHSDPTPRTGGITIFLVFLAGCILAEAAASAWSVSLYAHQNMHFFLGGFIVLGIGLLDDFIRVGYRVKFLFQVLAASLAFWGGIRIEVFYLGDFVLHFEYLSYFVTVFWFLLLINAINLIDGLDGLAGGLIFFVSTVMLVLLLMQELYVVALFYAILAGAILGFLFYNFSPAHVFLGDSGSYFLGYAMGALSIMGSVKSQVSTAILLPLVILGVPILDTCIAPLRRLCNGKKMFLPDKGHVHHRLLQLGFSTYKSMWILYLATLVLCLLSLFLVNFRKPHVGLALIGSGVCLIVFFQAVRILHAKSHSPWSMGINWLRRPKTDQAEHESYEQNLVQSADSDELWGRFVRILDELHIDQAELHFSGNGTQSGKPGAGSPCLSNKGAQRSQDLDTCIVWSRNGGIEEEDKWNDAIFMYENPFANSASSRRGKVVVFKDKRKGALPPRVERMVKRLSRTFCEAMQSRS